MDTVIAHIESQYRIKIDSSARISGGDINDAYTLKDSHNKAYFLKVNRYVKGYDMLKKESLGLMELANSKSIATPKIYNCSTSNKQNFLLLEYIPQESKGPEFWTRLGASLATLHQSTNHEFGFKHDNYIGRLDQVNTPSNSWIDFYINKRLGTQVQLAYDNQRISSHDANVIEKFCTAISKILEEEKPSLCHGDLWNGNIICGRNQKPWVIDPAVYYGHREVDMAMTYLFGGFDDLFYKSYQNSYPLNDGYKERIPIYQLYYLLVHLNLFGTVYYNQSMEIINAYT